MWAFKDTKQAEAFLSFWFVEKKDEERSTEDLCLSILVHSFWATVLISRINNLKTEIPAENAGRPCVTGVILWGVWLIIFHVSEIKAHFIISEF